MFMCSGLKTSWNKSKWWNAVGGRVGLTIRLCTFTEGVRMGGRGFTKQVFLMVWCKLVLTRL
ncbi:hypothetical protein HYC85_007928 [Camellia sinensis]|uniref:Uncharacterized protein n=1 Tax=Camellia sinensis TaxID=4442 RepID=A0A7J7HQB6_CAMSI|nr:hypothetical protein HYC85_007928 [Camellia sinensis]